MIVFQQSRMIKANFDKPFGLNFHNHTAVEYFGAVQLDLT
jgi:hypothetical protein